MITGGVLDAKEKGVPGELKMPPEMVKAVCDKAHQLGYKVAAHVESSEGVRVALENGVDSIEHGAKLDDEMLALFKEKKAFLCTTISPALPFALFDPSISNVSEIEKYNGELVFNGIIDCVKQALENDIPVVFAKKGTSKTVNDDLYTSEVYSYTKGTRYIACVKKKYLNENENVILVDDFLADGNAMLGLVDMCNQAKAHIVGCGIIIEKGFQKGHQKLVDLGYRVESLAIIESFENGKIVFK